MILSESESVYAADKFIRDLVEFVNGCMGSSTYPHSNRPLLSVVSGPLSLVGTVVQSWG